MNAITNRVETEVLENAVVSAMSANALTDAENRKLILAVIKNKWAVSTMDECSRISAAVRFASSVFDDNRKILKMLKRNAKSGGTFFLETPLENHRYGISENNGVVAKEAKTEKVVKNCYRVTGEVLFAGSDEYEPYETTVEARNRGEAAKFVNDTLADAARLTNGSLVVEHYKQKAIYPDVLPGSSENSLYKAHMMIALSVAIRELGKIAGVVAWKKSEFSEFNLSYYNAWKEAKRLYLNIEKLDFDAYYKNKTVDLVGEGKRRRNEMCNYNGCKNSVIAELLLDRCSDLVREYYSEAYMGLVCSIGDVDTYAELITKIYRACDKFGQAYRNAGMNELLAEYFERDGFDEDGTETEILVKEKDLVAQILDGDCNSVPVTDDEEAVKRAEDLRDAFSKAVATLTATQRDAIEKFGINGWNEREIAKNNGKTHRAVEVSLIKARYWVVKYFEENRPDLCDGHDKAIAEVKRRYEKLVSEKKPSFYRNLVSSDDSEEIEAKFGMLLETDRFNGFTLEDIKRFFKDMSDSEILEKLDILLGFCLESSK